MPKPPSGFESRVSDLLPELERVYTDIHSHPELSFQETRTARIAAENVIPDEAILKLNVRTFDEDVRQRVLAAITRIVNAEAAASGAPKLPEITPLDSYSPVANDPEATQRVAGAFQQYFGDERTNEAKPTSASEDFGQFGAAWETPSVFWFVGGTDAQEYETAKQAGRLREIPTNHNPAFAPVMHPTLETGVEAMIVASRAWLAP